MFTARRLPLPVLSQDSEPPAKAARNSAATPQKGTKRAGPDSPDEREPARENVTIVDGKETIWRAAAASAPSSSRSPRVLRRCAPPRGQHF